MRVSIPICAERGADVQRIVKHLHNPDGKWISLFEIPDFKIDKLLLTVDEFPMKLRIKPCDSPWSCQSCELRCGNRGSWDPCSWHYRDPSTQLCRGAQLQLLTEE